MTNSTLMKSGIRFFWTTRFYNFLKIPILNLTFWQILVQNQISVCIKTRHFSVHKIVTFFCHFLPLFWKLFFFKFSYRFSSEPYSLKSTLIPNFIMFWCFYEIYDFSFIRNKDRNSTFQNIFNHQRFLPFCHFSISS